MTVVAAAETSWPEAAVAIAGIALVVIIAAVAIIQVSATLRSRGTVAREEAYRTLAERCEQSLNRIASDQKRSSEALTGLGERTAELERMLKEV